MDSLRSGLLALADELGGPLLALDTSGAAASVCRVGWRAGEVDEEYLSASVQQTEAIGKALADAAGAASLKMAALRAIVVGIGPGSFTGLRVGLAMAKGIAYAAHVPIYAVSSLAMMAASQGEGRVALSMEARKGEIYAAVYDVRYPIFDVRLRTSDVRPSTSENREPGTAEPKTAKPGTVEPQNRRTAEPQNREPQNRQPQNREPQTETVLADSLTTPSAFAEALRPLNPTLLVGDVPVGDYSIAAPKPLRVAHGILIAAARLRVRAADDLSSLTPRYLKVSEAERNTP